VVATGLSVGTGVGRIDGVGFAVVDGFLVTDVGFRVGASDGEPEESGVGTRVAFVGTDVGVAVISVGTDVGVVGIFVGADVGAVVFPSEGANVGTVLSPEGADVTVKEGDSEELVGARDDGLNVGPEVGKVSAVGLKVGPGVGTAGVTVGAAGAMVGSDAVGITEGLYEGMLEGMSEGNCDESFVGANVGLLDGLLLLEGLCVGATEGRNVGPAVGTTSTFGQNSGKGFSSSVCDGKGKQEQQCERYYRFRLLRESGLLTYEYSPSCANAFLEHWINITIIGKCNQEDID
jgi:hypothetical protein